MYQQVKPHYVPAHTVGPRAGGYRRQERGHWAYNNGTWAERPIGAPARLPMPKRHVGPSGRPGLPLPKAGKLLRDHVSSLFDQIYQPMPENTPLNGLPAILARLVHGGINPALAQGGGEPGQHQLAPFQPESGNLSALQALLQQLRGYGMQNSGAGPMRM